MRKAPPRVLAVLAVILVALALAGCVTHATLPQGKTETVATAKALDIDGDGAPDLFVYTFAPVRNGNVTVARQVSIAVHRSSNYTELANISDLQMLGVRSRLDNFASSESLALEECALNAGLKKDCTDVQSCSALCAGSFKCDKVMTNYHEAVASSMIEFVNDRNRLDTTLLEARNMVLNLRLGPPEQKGTYLNKMLDATEELAEIYANPLYNRQEVLLCQLPNLNATVLYDAASQVGNYTPSADSYDYMVTITVNGVADAAGGIDMTDTVPAGVISNGEDATSEQNIDVSQNGTAFNVFWKSSESSPAGYMLSYRFTSAKAPGGVVAQMRSPAVGVGRLELGGLGLTDYAFNRIYAASSNFFISLGASLSLTLILLLVLYNLLTLAYYVLRAKTGREGATAGVRKAFGRTEVRWKTDAAMAVLLLAAGYYITVFSVSGEGAPSSLLGALDYFTTQALTTSAAVGLAGVGCVFLGLLLVYTAAENRLKIAVLEQAYGVVIKEEKDVFANNVTQLRSRVAELARLIEAYTAEEFDVGSEYDVLTSVPKERIGELAAKMTPESKSAVEQSLSGVEAAIGRLTEKKRTADANWQKWNETIGKLLSGQEEVYVSSLITVPASLRAWALSRYAKEHAEEGVVFERDTLKRKKITPDAVVRGMIREGLLLGAFVVQKDALAVAEMSQGSATVQAVLALKLRSYLHSLAKSLGQHEPTSFAAVGDKTVLVIIRDEGLDSTLIIPREKFKDAVDEWKKKSKVFAKGE